MIITQTPLRISFAGGGTDLPDYFKQREGYVVSAAIDKFVFVIVNERYDEKIYVNYSRKEIVDEVDDLEHELVREAMRLTGTERGIEVTMLSDIPSEGTGLGSSSSFTVGLLNAFHIYQGEQVSPDRLAEEACEIEIARCRKPIGKQDQYIAAFGGVCAFRFRQDEEVEVEKLGLSNVQLRRLAGNLFLFYTGQTRRASDILSEQKRRTLENIQHLDAIKASALDVRDALLACDFDRVGKALDENWRIKKRLASRITNPRIDKMHKLAMKSGALGAKIPGAGGGGFMLCYCPAQNHDQLLDAMTGYRQMPFLLERDGSKTLFNYRRYTWK